jgi:hypothetical protein
MVSCGAAAAIPGRQRSMGKISGFDVVDGSVRIYVRSMVGEPGRGLSGATTRTRYWSPSSAWHRDGWWACCVGGAGRDLRHVGSGLVQTGQLAGISGCAGLLWVGWRAAEVVTELSQAARNMVGRKQMR